MAKRDPKQIVIDTAVKLVPELREKLAAAESELDQLRAELQLKHLCIECHGARRVAISTYIDNRCLECHWKFKAKTLHGQLAEALAKLSARGRGRKGGRRG